MMRSGIYLNKAETLAVLLHGGIKESTLLALPNVGHKDIKTAKDLLRRAFSGFDREMDEYVKSVEAKT